MIREPFSRRAPQGWRPTRLWAALALCACGLPTAPAFAQAPAVTNWIARGAAPDVMPAYAQAIIDGGDAHVTQAGCASCGSALPAVTDGFSGGCASGGCACSDGCESCNCKPGHSRNCPFGSCGANDGPFSRFFAGIGECLCCPDACYEPVYNITANAAFFQDSVRPRSQFMLRYDAGENLTQPDRAEYFWAKIGGRGPKSPETGVDYNELSTYLEVASDRFSFFISEPYRSYDSDVNGHHANFGDLFLGTKSLLLDCELLQVTFQFRVDIPTGNASTGIGTGHTSLEPSLLASLKLTQDTYIQAQLAEWIPVGGNSDYEGAILHYHFSLNHSWWKHGGYELISSAEANGWTFQDGALTTPAGASVKASGETYVTLGSGLRLVFCDKADIGFGAAFAVTDDHFADQLYRTEFRIRY